MNTYEFTRSRIFQWLGILLALGLIAVSYWYYRSQASTLNSSSTDPMSTGLAGYWALDDGSGTSATDSSTNANTGTLTNGPTWTTGQIGGAVDSDGSNDYITAGSPTTLDNIIPITISGWFYIDTVTSSRVLVAKSATGFTGGWLFRLCSSDATNCPSTANTINFSQGFSTQEGRWYAPANSISTGQWIHIAMSYDKSSSANDPVFYINGVKVATSEAMTPSGSYSSDASDSLLIGNSVDVTASLDGKLDEIRLYNRILSPDEVARLYRLSSPTGVDTNLKGYWTFDGKDISGTTALDRSGAGNNGTLTNSPQVVEGRNGQALNFFPNGSDSNSYVTMGDPASGSLDFGSGDFTLSTWMKGSGYSSQGSSLNAVVTKKNTDVAGSAGYRFYYTSSNFMIFNIGDGTTDYTITAGTTTVSDQQWHHYTGVRSGSTMYLYIDGTLVGSTSVSGSVSSNNNFSVGSDGSDVRNVNALLDEVRVYSAALSASQIQSLYAQGQSDKVNSSVSQSAGTGRLDSGLAGYWALDDGSGTSATDSSTNANTGTLTGGPTWTTGQIGSAVDFDGTDDYVTVADTDALDVTDSTHFTLTGWFNRDTYTADHTIIAKRNGQAAGDTGYVLYVDDANDDVVFEVSDGTDEYSRTSNSSFTSSGWQHVAAVFDDTLGMTIYINGTVNQDAASGTIGNIGSLANTVAFRSGAESDAGSPFDGKLDEIRLYNRVLSPDEVNQLYRLTTPTAVDTGLRGYWSFNAQDMSGSTVYDRSGRPGNSGTSSATRVEGKIGQALSFNGSSQLVSISASPSLSTPTYATYSAWINTSGDPGHAQYILREGNGSVYSLYLAATTRNLVFANISGTNDSGYVIPVNTWVLATVTIDNGTIRFYVNGVQVSQQSRTVSAIGSAFVYLGAYDNGPQFVFNGKLDEVRIYSRALSAGEVKSLYDAGESDKMNSSVSQSQGTGRLDSGLAGYWKLDDGSGTSATDSSTNANTGTLTNGPTWTTGQIGGAVDFDGTNDYITVPDSNSLDSTDNLTISAWVKADSWTGQSGYATFVKKDSNYILRKDTLAGSGGSGIKVYWWDGTNIRYLVTTSLPSTSVWHHIVGVVRNNDVASLYIDGALVASTAATYLSGARALTSALEMGSGVSGTESLDGQLDEVRIYNWALSTEEVGQLYRLASPTGTETSLKGYWSFNGQDVSGTTAYDRSGSGNNGTLTNGPSITEGKMGQALSFDGSDDYIDVSDADAFTQSALTVSFWKKNVNSLSNSRFVTKSGSSNRSWSIESSDAGRNINFIISSALSTESNYGETPSGGMSVGQWHHVVCVFNGTGSTNAERMQVYINGVAQSITFTGTIPATLVNNTQAVTIGGKQSAAGLFGSLDEVRIYNRAFSPAEVVALYNQSR